MIANQTHARWVVRWLSVRLIVIVMVTGLGCREATPPPPVIRSSPSSNLSKASISGPPIVVTAAVSPSSDYVGSQVCAQCHAEISQSYSRTSMANSAAIASEATEIENYESDWVTGNRGFRVRATKSEAGLIHTEQLLSVDGRVLCEQSVPIAYELGSGKRGRSYLIERDDQLMMSPLTWYSMALRWDASPGYTKSNLHFERKIVEACVQCHVGRIAPSPSPLENRFAKPALIEPGIGCERCHGPAGRHVALHLERKELGIFDRLSPDPIVNPAALAPDLRESVCNDCHLLGAERVLRFEKHDRDFRPGDPLDSVWVIFNKGIGGIGSGQSTEAVNHVPQMEGSQCFQKSAGRLGCISCHDPHSQPEPKDRVQFFRNKCIDCHQAPEQECRLPQPVRVQKSPEDSCIACHMPSLSASDVQHTSQTDHRILRNPGTPGTATSSELLSLRPTSQSLPEWEIQRARGILMTQYALEFKDPALALLAQEALMPLPERGLNDPVTERCLGDTFLLQNRLELAEQHWRKALELNPRDEPSLRSLSIAVHDAGRDEEAEQLFSQYLKFNRWDRTILGRHIHVLGRLQRHDEAFREAEEAIEKFPTDSLIRHWMSDACEAAGRIEEARVHRTVAERLAPR